MEIPVVKPCYQFEGLDSTLGRAVDSSAVLL